MRTERSWKAVMGVLSIVALANGASLGADGAQERRSVTTEPLLTPAGFPAALHPPTLADNAEALAGLNVTILNARIVDVFEPHAFLIESAPSRNRMVADLRDRILVLLPAAALRPVAEPMTASPVTVTGVARTLFGIRASGEVPWPVLLDRERIRRLEVRAAVLATSVRTVDGTDLTDRR